MSLGLTPMENIARARSDLRIGIPVIVKADRMALCLPVETLTSERLEAIRSLADEHLLVLTDRRAHTLKLAAYDQDLVRIDLPMSFDKRWVQSVADPSTDLSYPMKGPFRCKRGGEVSIERTILALLKSAQLLPAAIVTYIEDPAPLIGQYLTEINASLTLKTLSQEVGLNDVIKARVPIQEALNSKLHIFRPDDGSIEHFGFEVGKLDLSQPILVRLHSACFTGDVLGSLKCDCGPQLRGALRHMGEAGSGMLLYLSQEGRGIGLTNKMRAYSLQDEGFDTVEANHRLGFEDDERDFRLGASILKEMGVRCIRLMTNNPAKIEMMERQGITVSERVPLIIEPNAQNVHYLATKAKKSQHLL